MKRLLGLLLVMGMVGCGGESSDTVESTPKQVADADAVAALKRLGAKITINEQGEVVEVDLAQYRRSLLGHPESLADVWLNPENTLNRQREILEVDSLKKRVTDADLVHLEWLTNLQTLILSGTNVTDVVLEDLKELTNLRELYLDNTLITDTGLMHLTELTGLQELGLGQTQITDAGLVNLKRLTNLRNLSLDFTKVSDAGLIHLKELTKLQWLDLYPWSGRLGAAAVGVDEPLVGYPANHPTGLAAGQAADSLVSRIPPEAETDRGYPAGAVV